MKRMLFATLILSMLTATGCKSGTTSRDAPEPTAESKMTEEMPEEDGDEATDESSDDESSGGRAGPHSEQMEVRLAGQPTVEGPGTLSPTAIRKLAEKRQERTTTCFKSFPGDIEEPSRQVMLTLRLSRDGVVLEVQSSAQDELGACVAAEVESWEFPTPEGGEVESTIEFEYGPSEGDDPEEAQESEDSAQE